MQLLVDIIPFFAVKSVKKSNFLEEHDKSFVLEEHNKAPEEHRDVLKKLWITKKHR